MRLLVQPFYYKLAIPEQDITVRSIGLHIGHNGAHISVSNGYNRHSRPLVNEVLSTHIRSSRIIGEYLGSQTVLIEPKTIP